MADPLKRKALTSGLGTPTALQQGYAIGAEPTRPLRNIGGLGLATGVLSDEEKERRRREKAASGRVITQEDL